MFCANPAATLVEAWDQLAFWRHGNSPIRPVRPSHTRAKVRGQALAIGQLLGRVLVGTDAIDPVTLFAVAGLLVVVGLSASVVPARRVMRLDPATVLRPE